jgi:hypothetical protein
VNFHHQPRKVLITGQSGTGKTTLWLARLRAWPARWKFVFDPDREAAGKLGWPVATAANQLEWAARNGRPICFDCTDLFPGDRPAGFDFFCGWIMAFVGARDPARPGRGLVNGPKVVAVDELQNFTEPGRGGLPLSFRVMLDAGRREETDLLLISQALNEVNHAVRRQLTEIITFRHSDGLALDWLAREGFDHARVAELRQGAYLTLDRRTRQLGAGATVQPGKAGARPAPARAEASQYRG